MAYLALRPSEQDVPSLYSRYYPSPAKGSSDRPGSPWERLKERLKNTGAWFAYQRLANPTSVYTPIRPRRGEKVLDVGCGAASAAAHWVEHRRGASWFGIEVNGQVCEYLRDRGFASYQGTIEDFRRTRVERFTYILLSQIIEHVYHPVAFLRIVRMLLAPGGMVVLACPNYDSAFRSRYRTKWLHWHIPYHVSQFNRVSLECLVSRAGLEIVRWATITPSSWYLAQRRMARGEPAAENAFNSRLGLQLYLNARFRTAHRVGRGDAIVTVLRAK